MGRYDSEDSQVAGFWKLEAGSWSLDLGDLGISCNDFEFVFCFVIGLRLISDLILLIHGAGQDVSKGLD